ncbi:alpha/beta fold hydrolase [Microbispora sp. H10836]|uniref:alpha/beta fold hydrolase n=1 Tax=Microbispora sp. H10836 TaxID=2729106 RepID=UPI001474FAE7|nr:alpha/beta hydrolase [Microbispora sp. H10836]
MREFVSVPGARLYTESAGEGPALLLVPGGGGDAGMYEAVVAPLSRRFTVISYDRRGNSRSRLADPATPTSVAEHADDAVAVLGHYGVERAYVFGSSAGAIITVDMVARHADRLLGAVAHEPPLVQIIPGGPEGESIRRLQRVAVRGLMRGWVAFAAMTMPRTPAFLLSPAGRFAAAGALRAGMAVLPVVRRVRGGEPGGMERLLGNTRRMLRVELPAFVDEYEPDLAALRRAAVPWCPATGRDSVGRPYHRPAHVLGELVGVRCEEFPGGHVPYQETPDEFVRTLTEILDGFSP